MSSGDRVCATKRTLINATRWILSGILCVMLSVSLCACSSNSRNNTSEPTGPTAQQPSPTATAEASPTAQPSVTEPPRKGSRSIFIYMCGSDLETKQGIASKMILELMQADVPEDMNIIIETGGAKQWRNLNIGNRTTERYQIKDGKLVLLERLDGNQNMGDPATLCEFASWCDQNYRSDRNMLILWDHGAGPLHGVCFDENYDYDALDLTELRNALENAHLSCKYDIIGFDACLMASVETMIAVHDYADYMIASQEIEPSGGWDLKAAAETFSEESDVAETGKAICDTYIKRCKEKNEQDSVSTMSLIDLSKTEELVARMQSAFEDLKDAEGKDYKLSALVDAAENSENFGTERSYGVYSNMIDLRSFVFHVLFSKDDVLVPLLQTIDESVVYFVNCSRRNNNGLSVYYPNNFTEKEVMAYLAGGPIPNYNSLLRAFYTGVPADAISFADRGSVSEDGAYTIRLKPESAQCLKKIYFELYEVDESGRELCIAKGRDFTEDWDTLTFKSNFRGKTVSMGGHRSYYEISNGDADFMIFYAPLRVNGDLHQYMFCYVASEHDFNGGYYISVGILDGYDEHGIPQRDFIFLENGDTVQLFDGIAEENGKPMYVPSEEYTLKVYDLEEYLTADSDEDTEAFYEIPLSGKTYKYIFVIEDFFGNTYRSDVATFEMTKTYEELSENPLPNGTYAANVIEIEPETPDTTR